MNVSSAVHLLLALCFTIYVAFYASRETLQPLCPRLAACATSVGNISDCKMSNISCTGDQRCCLDCRKERTVEYGAGEEHLKPSAAISVKMEDLNRDTVITLMVLAGLLFMALLFVNILSWCADRKIARHDAAADESRNVQPSRQLCFLIGVCVILIVGGAWGSALFGLSVLVRDFGLRWRCQTTALALMAWTYIFWLITLDLIIALIFQKYKKKYVQNFFINILKQLLAVLMSLLSLIAALFWIFLTLYVTVGAVSGVALPAIL